MTKAIGQLIREIEALHRRVAELETREGHNFSALNVGSATGAATGELRTANASLRENRWEQWSTDAESNLSINYDGYNGGTTQFRNLDIWDGKEGQIAHFNGSDKLVTFYGGVYVTGDVSALTFTDRP